MATLVFFIWQRRRKRWHPADLPLAQLSKRLSKHNKALARNESEGQLAWLERLAMVTAVDSEKTIQNRDVSKLVDSSDLTAVQIKIEQIKDDYRQLRYGRLSTQDIRDKNYQKVLKQLKENISDLPRLY